MLETLPNTTWWMNSNSEIGIQTEFRTLEINIECSKPSPLWHGKPIFISLGQSLLNILSTPSLYTFSFVAYLQDFNWKKEKKRERKKNEKEKRKKKKGKKKKRNIFSSLKL